MPVQRLIASLGHMIAQVRGRTGGGYLIFTGAGASVSSGYPLGQQVIDRYLELLYPYELPESRVELFKKEHSCPPTFAAVSQTVLERFGANRARDWILPLFQKGQPS